MNLAGFLKSLFEEFALTDCNRHDNIAAIGAIL
jgi:hypothetical protein